MWLSRVLDGKIRRGATSSRSDRRSSQSRVSSAERRWSSAPRWASRARTSSLIDPLSPARQPFLPNNSGREYSSRTVVARTLDMLPQAVEDPRQGLLGGPVHHPGGEGTGVGPDPAGRQGAARGGREG